MGKIRQRTTKASKTCYHEVQPELAPPTVPGLKHTSNTHKNVMLDWLCVGFVLLFSMFIYLSTVYPSLPGGDSGELIVSWMFK